MGLKNTVEDFEKHGIFRRLVESDRDGDVITQIISYLDALLEMFQASPSTSMIMCAR